LRKPKLREKVQHDDRKPSVRGQQLESDGGQIGVNIHPPFLLTVKIEKGEGQKRDGCLAD